MAEARVRERAVSYRFGWHLLRDSRSNEAQHFFVAQHVPDAVAGKQNELPVIVDCFDDHVRSS